MSYQLNENLTINVQRELDKIPYIMDRWYQLLTEKPDAIFCVDGLNIKGYTISEAERISGCIYHYLKLQGIGKENTVMICLPRGVLPIIAILGVIKAGAAFTIVESNYSPERINFIKNDFGCSLMIDIDCWDEICACDYLKGYEETDNHDLAFSVYTSGSTGTPKGVLHEYGNIKMSYLSALGYSKEFPNGMRSGLIAPLNFVASIKTILESIYFEHTVYVIPYSIVKNLEKLREFYIDNKIERTFMSPSLFRIFGENFGQSMRCVIVGSEPTNNLCATSVKLINVYAMSESCFSPYAFFINRPYEKTPIGKPLIDMPYALLDEDGNEVEKGKVGEICFYNPYFRGYHKQPEATKEALKYGLYHTNDLGFESEDGNIVICGRANDMIKINGNRIEPAEIEAAYKKIVGNVWCAAKGFVESRRSYICLYILEKPDMPEAEIIEIMKKSLPYYMLPSYIVKIDEVPMKPNGKMDRGALPAPQIEIENDDYVAPESDLEKKICSIFAKILEVERVGINDDFFKYGGDSLGALKVITELKDDIITVVDLYREKTAKKLAEFYESKKSSSGLTSEEKETYARTLELPLTDFELSMLEYSLCEPKSTMMNIPLLFKMQGIVSAKVLEDALNKVIENTPLFKTVIFFNDDCELRQKIDNSLDVSVKVEKMAETTFREELTEINQVFHLINNPLIIARIVQTEENLYLFLMTHHMFIDGYGYRALLDNIVRVIKNEALTQDRFYSYLYDESIAEKSESYVEAKAYFDSIYKGTDWYYRFEPDYVTTNHVRAGIMVNTGICENELKEIEACSGMTRTNLVMALTLIVMNKYSKKSDIMLDWVYHNRNDESRMNSIGILMRCLTVGIHFDKLKTLQDLYTEIQEQNRNSITYSVYEWGLKHSGEYENDPLLMIYEGNLFGWGSITQIGAIPDKVPNNAINQKDPKTYRHFNVLGIETPKGLAINASYIKAAYKEENIEKIEKLYKDISKIIFSTADPTKVLLEDL